jgi:hypothetical protein
MSFSLQSAGVPGHVAHQLRLQAAESERFDHGNAQRDRVLQLLAGEVAEWPEGKDLVVEASGHADHWSRNLTVTIRSFHRHTDPDAVQEV